jgi:hypothetical protein
VNFFLRTVLSIFLLFTVICGLFNDADSSPAPKADAVCFCESLVSAYKSK